MRVVDNLSTNQMDEECDWYKLEGSSEEYERTFYNLKLVVHSMSTSYEVYPLRGYQNNSVVDGQRMRGVEFVGWSKQENPYHKEAILNYLNKFCPDYVFVDVCLLTEKVCYRRNIYTYGKGIAYQYERSDSMNSLMSVHEKPVSFHAPKGFGPQTLNIIFRKIVDIEKIDTIVKTEEETLVDTASCESFYVYEHYYYDKDLQKEIVFYVGKGTGEAKGSGSRIYSFNRNKFWQEIVRSLDERNIKWEYRIVKFFNSNTEALEFEVELQEHYWNQGQCLGCADLRRRHKYV